MRNVLGLITIVALGLYCNPTQAQGGLETGRIVAAGAGSAVAVPDLAFTRVSFTALEASPQAAMAAGASAIEPLIIALMGLGIEERDIQGNNLRLQPKYGPDGCGSAYAQEPVDCKLLGFEMSNSLAVRIRDLDMLGEVLSIFAASDGGQIGDLTLSSSKPDELEAHAYADALTKAKRRAELTAATLGVSLGDIVGVRETSAGYGDNRPATLADGIVYESEGQADLAIMLPRGELTFNRHVEVTWAIAPND